MNPNAMRAVLLLSGILGATVSAAAAPTPEDSALATELFNQGRELMAAGKAHEACPKLAESHRLDPGGGTVLNLGLCYEAIGKLASAYSAFNDALAMARRDDRDDRITIATEHLASVEPRLSRLIIEVPPGLALAGMSVTRDGSEVARAAWGSAMPVDGGPHEVVVAAPGYRTWRATVEVKPESDKQTLVVPRLEAEPRAEPPRSVIVAPVVAPVPDRPPRNRPHSDAQRTWGFIVGGVGVIGVGAGTYLGVRALSKKDESEALCKHGCTVRGSELSREATTFADWSTASFGFGIATLGLGTYLVLSAPERPSVGLSLGPRGAGVRGSF
ncbi:MAG: PEGA domain-containing protein [Polyangiaceae bacterium]|nr:PEGA domain-containing protein [Polyangiaceae bacterium]